MRVRASVYALMLSALLSNTLFVSPASAHGAVDYPPARQVICKLAGGEWGPPGSIPDAGCRDAALAYPGTLGPTLSQWPGFWANVADYNNQKAVEKEVPDGTMCYGGQLAFSSMGVVTPNWTKTPVKLRNGKLTVRFSTTVDHVPSFFKIYLSKPGYRGDRPLTWADLEQIGEERYEVNGHRTDWDPALPPPPRFDPRIVGFHQFEVPVPEGRTGNAVLFVRWQRTMSSIEGFYNCSDISFSNDDIAFPWYDKEALTPFSVRPGDRIRFRIMDGTRDSGNEIVDVSVDITDQNLAPLQWSRALVNKLSAYTKIVQIGERKEKEIVFNPARFEKNRIYTSNARYVPVLDYLPKDDPANLPLKAKITGPASVTAGQTATYDGTSSSGGMPPYKYSWTAPMFNVSQLTGPSIQVVAPRVTQPVSGNVTLKMVDSLNKEATVTLDVTNNPGNSEGGSCGNIPAWDPVKIYQTYLEPVYYKGKVYRQNFYNINKNPETHSADYGKEWFTGTACPVSVNH